jgi:hypothetical protein
MLTEQPKGQVQSKQERKKERKTHKTQQFITSE